MGKLVCETQVNAPASRVFEVITDIERWPDGIEGVLATEKLTAGPVAIGTQFTETRKLFGKEATETFTFTDIVPGEQYTLVGESCGMRYESVHALSPNADGTLLRLEMDSIPLTLPAKIMWPVMNLLMKSTMRKMIQKDLDDIARVCEGDR